MYVHLQCVHSLKEVQKFKMTGSYDKLQLSATDDKGVTYYLYASLGDTGYGTLSAITASERESALQNCKGTTDFKFLSPPNM